ncbi:hypothetical protein C2W64_04710 [Brevibacillus laterosporus]|nr:DUF2399 domain-containing protein [Brevibacillus laterosporus]RAP28654.1 hypothetical protein C2W64_04710 [Brevibacillus laterosporus]
MIPVLWREFIEQFILLADEEIDELGIVSLAGKYEIPVLKRTARIRRKVALLTCGILDRQKNIQVEQPVITTVAKKIEIPSILVKQFTSPKNKKKLSETEELFAWIQNGWILQEVRFQKDEKTVLSEYFRMGPVLYQYVIGEKEEKEKREQDSLNEWIRLCEKSSNKSTLYDLSPARKKVLVTMESTMQTLKNECLHALNQTNESLPPKLRAKNSANTSSVNVAYSTWKFSKQLTFLHFMLAVYQKALSVDHFDWKEIGASYYQTIGGSKQFDPYKKDFLELLEYILQTPLQVVGLISLGTITPIFFSGELEGKSIHYSHGTVHASTDIAVYDMSFQTTAQNIWLVENRGVLTRMAYETEFLQQTSSFVLCVDGQVRNGHRELITQLVQNSPNLNHVMIWTDCDESGYTIAKELYRLTNSKPITLILPTFQTVNKWGDYEQIFSDMIQTSKREQEEHMGGPEQWLTWINH